MGRILVSNTEVYVTLRLDMQQIKTPYECVLQHSQVSFSQTLVRISNFLFTYANPAILDNTS